MTTINSLVTNVLKNIHFLTTVAIAFCGMEEEKKLRKSTAIVNFLVTNIFLLSCSTEERNSYRFGSTQEWVNDEISFLGELSF